jgi:trimethylamine:corrinoid methyltransferase-like protein
MPEDHTLEHFRENWLPQLFDRTHFSGVGSGGGTELYDAAHRKVRECLSAKEFWEIEPHRARDIDQVVERAKRELQP